KEQRLSCSLGQGIREAVAKIQPGWVFALAIGTVGVAGDFSMLHAYWHDCDVSCGKEKIEFVPGRRAFEAFDNDGSLFDSPKSKKAYLVCCDVLIKSAPFRLVQEDGHQRGRIDHRQRGKPCSS